MFETMVDLFIAGTETTASTMSWLLAYMLRYPEVQTKCQQEIDQVSETTASIIRVTQILLLTVLIKCNVHPSRNWICSLVSLSLSQSGHHFAFCCNSL